MRYDFVFLDGVVLWSADSSSFSVWDCCGHHEPSHVLARCICWHVRRKRQKANRWEYHGSRVNHQVSTTHSQLQTPLNAFYFPDFNSRRVVAIHVFARSTIHPVYQRARRSLLSYRVGLEILKRKLHSLFLVALVYAVMLLALPRMALLLIFILYEHEHVTSTNER